ncbi:MAG TPA: ATP-binding protein [Candidatus Sulfomarinibacteraceae bacterium]|nr:ATP-binding protein [Candidatus Sulfomarinibacteraceae bacterium]
MSRGRHLLESLAASSPLLAAMSILGARQGGAEVALAAGLWLVGVVLLDAVLWRRVGRDVEATTKVLGGVALPALAMTVRELKATAEACHSESQKTAARLEDLSSSLGDGLIVVTSDLRIRLINPPALAFCGVASAGRGSHLLEVLRDPVVLGVVEAAAAGGRPDPEVIENRSGLWEVRGYPVRDGGAVVLLAEVSLVRRSAEFRRRFVQDLSHELRSPLAVLRTTVETLEGEIDRRLAEVLIRQVERLDRLTRELYDLATIESGQLELELERVVLGPVVRDVLADFGPEANAAGVELRAEVADDVSSWCDRRGLYRVLSNLLDNAIKYNRRGGWAEVRATIEGDGVTVEVSDSGEGIPPSELRAVLQRFYRVDRARTPGRGGLGLGLAIVKHMVQYMGGSLELRSREGVGTTVRLSLPGPPRRGPDESTGG